jgi:uncharacterized protein YdaU (DUF1376 family)
MARKSPAFSFYPDSFIGGTLTLSTAETGVYIKLLAASWLHGQLSFSFCLAFCSDIDSVLVERILRLKFQEITPGCWINQRLEEERKKQQIRSENGKKGGRPKAKGKANEKLNGKLNDKLNLSPDSDSDSVVNKEAAKAASNKPYSTSIGQSDVSEVYDEACSPQDVLDCWSHFFKTKLRMTSKRRRVISVRLKDRWWHDHFAEAIERASQSKFCLGENQRGWVANLDWLIRPDTVTKIMEGSYETAKKNPYAGFPTGSTAGAV